VKTLVLHAEATHGRAAADGLLAAIKLERDYLDDETRALSRDVWHAALEEFASRFGRQEIARVIVAVVHPDNLGVFTRVLRGAADPGAAYRQLDQYGGDEVLTERWVTIESGPSTWRGLVPVHPDAEHEGDGLMTAARAAEIAAVPLLFGLSPAQVTVKVDPRESGIEFEAHWQRPGWARSALYALGAAAGAGGLALATTRSAAVTLAGTGVGAVTGVAGALEIRRRGTARAQLRRIQALERAATLRDARERGAQVFREGSVIGGQYRLGPSLGAGASGSIWEAIRLSDGAEVAIKLLRAAVAHDTVTADRLRREAAALGLSWHPNVVEVLDEGYLPDGTCFLVMERLLGESLEKRLERVGTLPAAEVLPMALMICDALTAVHAAGVVHRDLKPSNVFLARAGEVEQVKVLDFGIARVEWAEPRLTITGVPMGTPGYMSPEQEQGVEIDARSDLYALGGVIYRALTGALPPERLGQLLESGSEGSGVRPLVHPLPAGWREAVMKATATLPRDRFPDARSMKAALEALAASSQRAGTR
jgi:Protein kinase domain